MLTRLTLNQIENLRLSIQKLQKQKERASREEKRDLDKRIRKLENMIDELIGLEL